LDETTMHRPGAVVASGGKVAVIVPGSTTGGLVPGLVVPGTTGVPGVVNPGLVIPGTTGDGGTGLGDLFGGSTGLVTPPKQPHAAPPTSGLNLLGQVESWGIGPATPVTNVVLKVGKMTGAQLQQLLKDLPAGVTYGLELEKEGS
jgi:hypothetical protein